MNKKIKVSVVGGSGYTGIELLRLLALHPNVEILHITSRNDSGKFVHEIYPSLRGVLSNQFVDPDKVELAIQIFIYESSFSYLIHYQGLNLHLYVLSIDLIVVGGYLINAFYDFEKDMINQPEKTYFNRLVSKRSCLNIYMLCNILGLLFTFLINNH